MFINNYKEMGINDNLAKAISSYLPEISLLPRNVIRLFIGSLKKLKSLGVDDIGFRVIDSDGYTYVFSTSSKWSITPSGESFQNLMGEHMNLELLRVKQENLKYITRSPCRVDSEYLDILNKIGLNNSIIKFNFQSEDQIKIIFLMSDTALQKDRVLNNAIEIDKILLDLQPFMVFIEKSNAFEASKFIMLKDNVKNILFNRKYCKRNNKKLLSYEGRLINLTHREEECLEYLGFGMSNKEIAKQIGISHLTVKDQIFSLRTKFGGIWRNELSELSRAGKVSNII